MNIYKLKLYEYFDSLINQVDLAVETAISENYHNEKLINVLNWLRDVLLHEIRNVQAINLKALSNLDTETHKELTNEELFPRFCFLIHTSPGRMRQKYENDRLPLQEFGLVLIVTDMYLTEGEIKCYTECFNATRDLFGTTLKFDLLIQENEIYVNNFFFLLKICICIINYCKICFFLNKELGDDPNLELKSSSFNHRKQPEIIIQPSKNLFNFDELSLTQYLGKACPDAQFLFANLRKLKISQVSSTSIAELSKTIKSYEEINLKGKLESIELKFKKEKDARFELLADYCIKSLEFYQNRILSDDLRQLKGNFNSLNTFCFEMCSLKRLKAVDFDFWASNLTNLEIWRSVFKQAEKSLFRNLVNLKELTLADCKFVDVDFDTDFVKGLDNLTMLNLTRTKFKSFKNEAFEKLMRLEKLNLGGVKLELESKRGFFTLKKESFRPLINLKSLDLSWCKMKEIESGAFEGLSNLTQLNMSQTSLKKLNTGCFRGLVGLKELSLSKSFDLSSLTAGVFTDLKSVEKIDMSLSTSIKFLPSSIFSGLSQLKHLNLSQCKIELVRPDAFDGLVNLEILDLRGNSLQNLNTKCTPKKLDLSRNKPLRSLALMAKDLSRVEDIDLDDNTNLADVYFDSALSNIQRLTAPLEAIDSNETLSKLTSLKELNLFSKGDRSEIKITSEAFHGLANLELLIIYMNQKLTRHFVNYLHKLGFLLIIFNNFSFMNSKPINCFRIGQDRFRTGPEHVPGPFKSERVTNT
jgi:Leucine-rich repeat (LRR) protein